MLHDPIQAMMARKAANNNSNVVRNKLQIVARNLERKAYTSRSNSTPEEIWKLIGEIEGYIQLRASLTPYIAQDGYSNTLKNCMSKLKSAMDNTDE